MLVVSIAPTLRLYRSFVLMKLTKIMCGLRVPKVWGVTGFGVHVLRNASIPIVTEVMASLPALLIGAFD